MCVCGGGGEGGECGNKTFCGMGWEGVRMGPCGVWECDLVVCVVEDCGNMTLWCVWWKIVGI